MTLRPSVLLLSSLLGLTQCIMSGEPYYPVQPMPAATQTGANTAGCLVDGLPWVAYVYGYATGNLQGKAISASWDNYLAKRPNYLSLYFAKDIPDAA